MMYRKLFLFCLFLAGIAVTANATPINLLDNFFADPDGAISFAAGGTSATLAEDPLIGFSVLQNDPGFGDPNVIIPGIGVSLRFDYDFVEGVGSDDEFGAFIVDFNTGGNLGGDFEFFTQSTSAGTVSFLLSDLVGGDPIGLQFQLSSDVNFDSMVIDDLDSAVTISNVRLESVSLSSSTAIPEPSTLVLMCIGILAAVGYRFKQTKGLTK